MSVFRNFSIDCRMEMCRQENHESTSVNTPRSILKINTSRGENEKSVERSLNLICNAPSARESFDSVADVFGNLCFDHFFKGECYRSLCQNQHNSYNFDTTHLPHSVLWSASLYVICHAASPDVGILKNLIANFDRSENVDEILTFARCVVTLKRERRKDFLEYLWDVLSRHVGKTNSITRILMSIYSEVDTTTFDNFLTELRIFDEEPSLYSDLIDFLRYRSHEISTIDLSKIGKVNELLGPFVAKKGVTSTICNKVRTKKVEFLEQDLVVEFDVDDDDLQLNEISNCAPIKNDNFQIQSIINIFSNFCLNWLLNGECTKLICSLRHEFDKTIFNFKNVDEIIAAAEFYVDASTVPNLKLLQIFVDALSRTVKFETALIVHKSSRKLSKKESVLLTVWVWSRLSKRIGNSWTAFEMILMPNVLDEENFQFDERILQVIMNEALDKSSLSTISNKAICRQIAQLTIPIQSETSEIIAEFFSKFILKVENVEHLPVGSWQQVADVMFRRRLVNAFDRSVDKRFFLLVCVELKFAVEQRLNLCDVVEHLTSLLQNDVHKTHSLERMLKNLRFLSSKIRQTVGKLLSDVAQNLAVDSNENGRKDEAIEIVQIVRGFNFIHYDEKSLYAFCRILSFYDYAEATSLFLLIFQTIVDKGVECSIEFVELCRQLFDALICSSAVEENLYLFRGIWSLQKSATRPLKIVDYYENTLRNCLRRPYDRNVRQSCIKLFLTVEESCSTVLSLPACRSLMITVIKEIFASCCDRPNRLPYLFQPVVGIVLSKCAQTAVYPAYKANCDEFCIYSYMTEEEITVYLLWWFKSFLYSRQSEQNGNYETIAVKILPNVVRDGLTLPVHCRLRTVDNGVVQCVSRLIAVVKLIVSTPLSRVDCRRVAFDKVELSAKTVRALCHKVIQCLKYQVKSKCNRRCTFCLDDKC